MLCRKIIYAPISCFTVIGYSLYLADKLPTTVHHSPFIHTEYELVWIVVIAPDFDCSATL